MIRPQGAPNGPRPEEGRGAPAVGEQGYEQRLLGRDTQLQALLSALLGMDNEPTPGALLIGETGMGKTSLLRMLDASVQGVLHGRACIGDKLVPYATLSRWLQQWVDCVTPALASALAPSLAGLLPQAASADQTGSTPTTTTGPPDVGEVHRLMLRAAPTVTAWTLDDLQLADDASAEWLLRLVQQSPPTALPWVISAQPPWPGSLTEAVLEAMAGLSGVRSVLLGPLGATEVLEWVKEVSPQPLNAAQTDAVVKRLLQATQGQPLHLQLLLRDLERHRILDAAGTATEPSLPDLKSVLGSRLGQLPPLALAVARAAAVAGQDFEADAAADFTGLHADELEAAFSQLQDQGLWRDGEFSHTRVREAARLATPEAMAKALHAHWAAWMENKPGGSPARIAAHWQAAGQELKALPALQGAARHAQRLHCMPERMACLMRAATIAEQHGQLDLAFDCCCEAFEAHTESIRHTDGDLLLEQMNRLARTPRQKARAATQGAWHAMVHGHLETAIERGEQALALAETQADDNLLAPARQHLGTALGVAGQLQRALPLLQQAQPWAQQHLPADELASFLGNLAAVLDNLGRADEAKQHHLSALALTARATDGTHRATLLANYAMSRLEAGDPLGARELAQKAQQLVEVQDAQSSTAGFIAALMAPCERTLGRYIAALDWCDRAEQILAARNPSRTSVAQLQRAHVWMDLGQHERALELLSGAGLPLGRQLPARHAVRWLLLQARAQVRRGQDPGATLREAYKRLPAEGWPELALLLRAEQALLRPDERGAAELRAVALAASQHNLHCVALGAWLQCAQAAAGNPQTRELAKEAADAALALMVRGVETPHVDRALRWLAPANALAAAGESARARGLILRGQQWLRESATEHVPPWASSSFQRLHPLNRLLQDAPIPDS
jgi:tetratricopeptide (TPR) repeat protein